LSCLVQLSAAAAEIVQEKVQAPAVAHPKDAVIMGVSLPTLKQTSLSAKLQKQLVAGVAGVLGVNTADVAVRKVTQKGGVLQAHISVNQVRILPSLHPIAAAATFFVACLLMPLTHEMVFCRRV
jgi:hypothetical protein